MTIVIIGKSVAGRTTHGKTGFAHMTIDGGQVGRRCLGWLSMHRRLCITIIIIIHPRPCITIIIIIIIIGPVYFMLFLFFFLLIFFYLFFLVTYTSKPLPLSLSIPNSAPSQS